MIDPEEILVAVPRNEMRELTGGVFGKLTLARVGAEGEIGEDGNLKRISVVPSPYTKPHPPVFLASNSSEATVRYAARMGFIPNYFTPVERALSHAGAVFKP